MKKYHGEDQTLKPKGKSIGDEALRPEKSERERERERFEALFGSVLLRNLRIRALPQPIRSNRLRSLVAESSTAERVAGASFFFENDGRGSELGAGETANADPA